MIAIRAVHMGGVMTVFAAFTFPLLVMQPALGALPRQEMVGFCRRFERAMLMTEIWSLLVSFISAVLWFWVEAAAMSGRSLIGALAPEVVGTVLRQTKFGECWAIRVALMVLIAALWLALWRMGEPHAKKRRALNLVVALLAGILLATLALAGHAASSQATHLAADIVHLLVGGIWPAGLLPFALVLALAKRDHANLLDFVGLVTVRSSAINLVIIGAIATTGLVNAWFLVGSIEALFASHYGRLLLLKVVLFACMISFGAINRFQLRPRLLSEAGHVREGALRLLQRNVVLELCVGVVVLIIVGAMGITSPARHPYQLRERSGLERRTWSLSFLNAAAKQWD